MKFVEIQSHKASNKINRSFTTEWSEDDVIATTTDKGIEIMKNGEMRNKYVIRCHNNNVPFNPSRVIYLVAMIIFCVIEPTFCNDITANVFGSAVDGMPAAFGDFDSDKFTDLFVLTNGNRNVKILLGRDTEPLLQEGKNMSCSVENDETITSVVPGDFDGDAYMDILVTVHKKGASSNLCNVYIFWGHGNSLQCNLTKLFSLQGQPLTVDLNQDMIIDLFGVNGEGDRSFWVFNKNRSFNYTKMELPEHPKLSGLKIPHSHAFLDLNYDNYGDLYLTEQNGNAEVWLYNSRKKNFFFKELILPPVNISADIIIGQTTFQDMSLEGKINQVVPVCFDIKCSKSSIYIRSEVCGEPLWHSVEIRFNGRQFVPPKDEMYLDTLTLRAGDFNMDGYPDLLATFLYNGQYSSNLLENVVAKNPTSLHCFFPRTFEIRSDLLSPYNNNTKLGVFYDFLQDGVLDIIFVDVKSRVSAFRNGLDYDANFVKVMVFTGLTYDDKQTLFQNLTRKERIYGTNLPGPTIVYNTTTPEGDPRSAVSTQLPQSAHYSLNLPYTIFGLGRTPNFIEELTVGVYGQKGKWMSLIPNSQLVVIPWPADNPRLWKAQLFVTPSKLIFQSFIALLGTCLLIALIICGLYWKERKEDHKEKMQEAQRFPFDAM